MKHLLSILLFISLQFSIYGQTDSIYQVNTDMQIDSTKNKFHGWVSAGINESYTDNYQNLNGYHLSINTSINQKYFFTLLYQRNNRISDTLYKEIGKARTYIDNYSALFGFGKIKYCSLVLIASTGVCFGKIIFNENTTNNTYNYVGVPVDLKAIMTTPYFGISMDFFINFHKHADFGFNIGISLGFIRDRNKEQNIAKTRW